MKRRNAVFCIAFAVFVVCLTQMAAVLYAGTPRMSSGSSISFSPFLDVVVWGTPMVAAAIVMACYRPKEPLKDLVSESLRYPVAYVVTQTILAGVVLMLGMCQILNETSRIHLPLYGYAAILCAAYVAAGFLWGRWFGGKVRIGLLCFGVLLVTMSILAGIRLAEISREIAERMERDPLNWPKALPVYTGWVMSCGEGQWLAFLNLPGCVVLGNYEYAFYDQVHSISRDTMTWLVTLVPATLFTGAWLVGRKTQK